MNARTSQFNAYKTTDLVNYTMMVQDWNNQISLQNKLNEIANTHTLFIYLPTQNQIIQKVVFIAYYINLLLKGKDDDPFGPLESALISLAILVRKEGGDE